MRTSERDAAAEIEFIGPASADAATPATPTTSGYGFDSMRPNETMALNNRLLTKLNAMRMGFVFPVSPCTRLASHWLPHHSLMTIRTYQPEDQNVVLDLWERCGLIDSDSRAVAIADLHRKLQVQPDLFLIGMLGEEVIATAMAGYDGHRGHLYYLAVCPQHQRHGYGRQIVTQVDKLLHERGCHRLTLFVSNDNLVVTGFYEQLGFEHNEVISMGRFTGT